MNAHSAERSFGFERNSRRASFYQREEFEVFFFSFRTEENGRILSCLKILRVFFFFFIFVTVVDLRIKNLFQSRNITISSLARIFCIFSYARLPVVLELKISHNSSSIRNLIIIIADVYIPVRNLI